MLDFAPFSILINAVSAPLSLAFLIILLWSSPRREMNQFLALFLFFLVMWNSGALLYQAGEWADLPSALTRFVYIIMDIGFTGASISIFALTAVIVKAYTRRLRALAFVTVLTLMVYRMASLFTPQYVLPDQIDVIYTTQPLLLVFLVFFGGSTLIILWRNRRAVQSTVLRFGLTLFVIAQFISFLNPELGIWTLVNNLGAIAGLIITFSIVRQEIVRPLAERTYQVEALRTVSNAIVNQESLDAQLQKITHHAADILKADGATILSREGQGLRQISTWQMPTTYLATRNGMAQTAFSQRKTILVDNYAHEWRTGDDFSFARVAFGSVICTPITHGDEALGVLLVVSARQGRLFRNDDIYMLELFSTQIAVAIVYHRLFERQQELDRLKSEMLRMASHDLKNPLQASMANLELMRDDLADHPNPDVHESIAVIEKQLNRMNRIIRGVLDLEKLRDGQLQLQAYPAERLIQHAFDEMTGQAQDHSITLSLEVLETAQDAQMICDPVQFERVLVNLTENAIKFTPSGGKVQLRLSIAETGINLLFIVQDSGVGIAEVNQPYIFERFFRASPPGMEHVSGSGLGLSLVKTVVERHHGTVWFESSETYGTTFFVSTPLANQDQIRDVQPDRRSV